MATPTTAPGIFDLLKKETDISAMRDTLIFGQAYQGGGPLDPVAAVAALPDDAEICGCNGVCKGTIISAIAKNGLTSLEEVRAQTKASASCGQCTAKVEALIASTLGEGYRSRRTQADVQMHRPHAMRRCAGSSCRVVSIRCRR